MAGDAKKLQPIIVKRVKKGGHAAHGGAWKIAYADFVTAMMAFFLLMWLLGSTTEGDKKGIADYFAAPLKVAMLGGSGAGDASHVIRGGGQDLTRATGQVKRGDIEAKRDTINLHHLKEEQRRAEVVRMEQLKQEVEEKIAANPQLQAMRGQIKLDMVRDGLRIQIMDEEGKPMFESGSALVAPQMRVLLREIGAVLRKVPYRLTLEGHTDSAPFGGGDKGYSNWELSSDRANASRRELMSGGLPEDRTLRVQGLAASVPLVKEDPRAPTNRRISIIVMNRDAEERFFRTAPEVAQAIGAAEYSLSAPPGPVLLPPLPGNAAHAEKAVAGEGGVRAVAAGGAPANAPPNAPAKAPLDAPPNAPTSAPAKPPPGPSSAGPPGR